jgi:hypothetical protein
VWERRSKDREEGEIKKKERIREAEPLISREKRGKSRTVEE